MTKSIIICSTQRSGSTMFCQRLEATGQLGKPKEFFWEAEPVSHAVNAATAHEIIRSIEQSGRTENGITSINLMWNQTSAADKVYSLTANRRTDFIERWALRRRRSKRLDAPNLDHLYLANRDAVWVLLIRRNKILQAISAEIARQTDIYNFVEKDSDRGDLGKCITADQHASYNTSVSYNFDSIERFRKYFANQNNKWRQFFDFYKIRPLAFAYEDICSGVQRLDPIFSAVSVKPAATTSEIASRKIGTNVNIEWEQRFIQDLKRLKKVSLG